MTPSSPVLVTGGSGFIAGHCILQLLDAGRSVRATLRSTSREASVRETLQQAGATNLDRLEFVAADLTSDDGWDAAMDGVDAVLHVASPVMPGQVKDEQTVISPAREGAVRVIEAARRAGARRVVLTSAFHAAGFGHGPVDHVFTEDDWSPLDGPGMDAYGRSKVLAERAAWDAVADGGPELVTILPVAVVGPLLGDSISGTNHLLQEMLDGSMPGTPDIAIPFVDVRDVATAHVRAIDAEGAAGKRILVAAQERATPMKDVAALLREAFGDDAKKVPTRSIPSFLLRIAGRFRADVRGVVPDLGYVKRVCTTREHELLGLEPRPWTVAVVDGARSMIERGLTTK